MDETGTRILQASATGNTETVLRLTAEGIRDVNGCRARWLALPGHLRRDVLQPPGRTGHVQHRQASNRGEPARPRGAAAAAAGDRALRDLASAPGWLAQVGRLLRPEHFARPEQGGLYTVMQDMAADGRPVDPVTICWEAARRGLRAEPRSLEGGIGPFAVASAREVHRLGVLAQTAHAGRAIKADAADLACRPDKLLQSAGERLRALQADVQPGRRPAAASGIHEPAEAVHPPQPQQAEREAVQ